MSDGGKGSSPRPFSIAHEEYSKRWDAIFQRDIKEETDSEEKKDEEKSGDQSNWENTSLARLSQRFESVILHQALIAQLVEQRISNAKVGSSSLSWGTKRLQDAYSKAIITLIYVKKGILRYIWPQHNGQCSSLLSY